MIVAEAFERVVGVDTHARTHTFCVIDTRTVSVAMKKYSLVAK